jgi:hypothetical protein
MGPTGTGRFNNCYADTEFYKKSSANPTFTGNWVRQLKQIARDFPKTSFFRVAGNTTAEIRDLQAVPNLAHVDIVTFQKRLESKEI